MRLDWRPDVLSADLRRPYRAEALVSIVPRRHRSSWRTEGENPDERFTLANERTFLAWNRTALGLIVAGLAITQLLPSLAIPGGRRVVGLPLIALGTVVAYLSYSEWVSDERALRLKAARPPSKLPLLVSTVITLTAAVALVLAAVE